MRRWAALALATILAGCSSAPTETTPVGSAPEPPAIQLPAPGPAQSDRCGAADQQVLVGRPRTEIPIPIDPNRQRVACASCPVTLDFSPERLNFFFDAASGLITEIRCG